jgi:hypothetical protein
MNSKLNSFLNNRGVLVVMAIIIIAVFGLIISMVINSGNFDNETVDGSYTGSLSFSDRDPFELNITFDGEKEISGIIKIDDLERPFTSEYLVESNDISFSITFEDLNLRFIGIVTSGATILSGEVQLISESTEIIGTFFLSRISN